MQQRSLLIALHAVARGGKDIAGENIAEWCASRSLTCKKRGFADEVKWIFARQFFPDISMEDAIAWVDKYKSTKHPIEIPSLTEDWDRCNINFRDAVKQFATDGARDIIDPDIWINQLLPVNYSSSLAYETTWWRSFDVFKGKGKGAGVADVCIITDERFVNEAERVRSLGGINIKIRRSFAEDEIMEDAQRRGKEVHLSDLLLPDEWFDYIIWNDNSLEEFKEKIFDVMDSCISTRKFSSGVN